MRAKHGGRQNGAEVPALLKTACQVRLLRKGLHAFREFEPGTSQIVELVPAQHHQIYWTKRPGRSVAPPPTHQGRFAEMLTLSQPGQRYALAVRHFLNNLHLSRSNHIKEVAYVALAKDKIARLVVGLTYYLCPA